MADILTQAQVQELCHHAGFTDINAKIASAIAMVEAPGKGGGADPDLIGDQELANSVWGFSYGLFQIRSLRADKGTGRYRDEEHLPNSTFNCQSAYIIWSQTGDFSSWTTYATGQYKAYLQDIYPPIPGTYVVLAGDSLMGIGEKLKLDWTEIARLNNIKFPYMLTIGWILRLPVFFRIVREGDTLSFIGSQYGVSWQTIAEYNHIADPDLIYPEQVLRIPRRS